MEVMEIFDFCTNHEYIFLQIQQQVNNDNLAPSSKL